MRGLTSITGVELGTDSCVLVRARQNGAAIEVSALHAVYAAEWPPQDVALAGLLRRIRREGRFPRRARVVAWQMPEAASLFDPSTRAALRPLTAAGFRIDALVSPPQALTLLAATSPDRGDGAAAWLALNRHGAAIAIVRGTELLFSRAFDWSYRGTGGDTTNAQLLERYSLVAHLAPELRHGMDDVRANYGAEVESVITCGDLPDLRSLTMPLIEELDLEVETLDSCDGLLLTPPAMARRGADLAPALRLACAVATRARTERPGSALWLKTVAAGAVIAGGAALVYSGWPARRAASPTPIAARPPAASRQTATTTAQGRGRPESNAPSRVAGSAPTTRAVLPVPQKAGPPGVQPGTTPASAPPKNDQPAASTGREQTPPAPPRPLDAPVPSVSSILISSERRLAVTDGRVVGVGDQVGPRVVARIEPGYVVLREPSGLELRVPLK